ncbi:MAG TPA: alkaline phosphatase family protein [Solirubrobacteraceae bacterium]|nr:alkaline phosphatase family protein [Solirubrobacteraceae bacterium]
MGILHDSTDGRSELQRRRDALAEQVTELHWDLGGLAYEMAIRDHFRLDVLVRHAASLQERDAELAEIERLLRTEHDGVLGSCPTCAAPHSRGAIYCWQCGATLMERHRSAAVAAVPAANAVAPAASAAEASGGLALPTPRISTLLVLVFLGFGILLGNVARSGAGDTLASARSPMRVVLPAAGPSASTSSPRSSSSSSSGPSSSEAAGETAAPESPAETTPTPTSAPAATKPSPAVTKAPSSSGSGASGSGGGEKSKPGAGTPAAKLPPIKHVFVIMLSDEPYASVFGPSSAAPYLSQTLEHQGKLLVRYDAVAHEELANELALLSGQGPTVETAANCPTYTDITPTGSGADEQVLGSGCVYPASTQTLPGQLSAKHLTSRAYVQGIDEAGAQPGACSHPALGQADPTAVQSASAGPYATFRNPFVYFDSIVGSPACTVDDVGLERLKGDLASAKRTPSFSYVVPDRCDDGNPTPCTIGAPAGLAPADTLLRQVVPEILASKAYKESGLLMITVDEAPSSGEFADSSSCCGEPLFPNDPVKTAIGEPRGGGAVGALLLSPYVKGATTSQELFNHFSLLRTIEDLFGLGHLGYAGLSTVKSFEPSMFTARKG